MEAIFYKKNRFIRAAGGCCNNNYLGGWVALLLLFWQDKRGVSYPCIVPYRKRLMNSCARGILCARENELWKKKTHFTMWVYYGNLYVCVRGLSGWMMIIWVLELFVFAYTTRMSIAMCRVAVPIFIHIGLILSLRMCEWLYPMYTDVQISLLACVCVCVCV